MTVVEVFSDQSMRIIVSARRFMSGGASLGVAVKMQRLAGVGMSRLTSLGRSRVRRKDDGFT